MTKTMKISPLREKLGRPGSETGPGSTLSSRRAKDDKAARNISAAQALPSRSQKTPQQPMPKAGTGTRPKSVLSPDVKKFLESVVNGEHTPLGTKTPQRTISPIWDTINPEDIGRLRVYKPPKKVQKPTEIIHPFVSGTSKFIYFIVEPRIQPKKIKKEVPINAETKLTKPQRKNFLTKMKTAMLGMETFWYEEILPFTVSIESAISNVDERMLQLLDVSPQIDKASIRAKVEDIVQLRLMRYLSSTFNLTKDEMRVLIDKHLPRTGVLHAGIVEQGKKPESKRT